MSQLFISRTVSESVTLHNFSPEKMVPTSAAILGVDPSGFDAQAEISSVDPITSDANRRPSLDAAK